MCGLLGPIGGIAGFMLGGPAGAAIGSGLGSLAGGKSPEQALVSAGLSYAGGSLMGGAPGGEVAGIGGMTPAEISTYLADAADPIEAISRMASVGDQAGGMLPSELAKTLGKGSVEGLLGSINNQWVAPSLSGLNPFQNFSLPDFSSVLKSAGLGGGGGNAGGGGGSWPWMQGAMSIGSGLYGMSQAEKMRKMMEQYAQQADPFAAYRPGYAAELKGLTSDPSSITRVPGYQAGLEAVQRSMGAQGYQGSGNMMAALQKYGGDFYNQEVQRLMQLSGANANPAAAGQIALSGASSANDLASRSLASMGYGVAPRNFTINLPRIAG